MQQMQHCPQLPGSPDVFPFVRLVRGQDDTDAGSVAYRAQRVQGAPSSRVGRLGGEGAQRSADKGAGQGQFGPAAIAGSGQSGAQAKQGAKVTMSRTYAAKRLLEHGPLTFAEFVEITGWAYRQAERTIQMLQETGIVVSALDVGCRRSVYELRAD